jgi:hypothetical protein
MSRRYFLQGNKMKSRFVPASLIFVMLLCLFSGCVKGPGIRFETEIYDFGSVDEGSIVDFDFAFTNNGTERLVILGVVSTCGCTRVGDFDREVQPGMSGKIRVSLNTKRLDGKVTKVISLGTNVPGRTDISLAIEGTVKPSPGATSNITALGEGNGPPFRNVETGETDIGSSPSASKEIKVVFAGAFSGTPRIIATVRNDPGYDVGETFAVTLRRISNTQFIANIVRVDKALPWNQNPFLDWMAWE